MLESLRKSIKEKKQQRGGVYDGDRVKSAREKELERELEENQRVAAALQSKSDRYAELMRGETSVIPRGALVDFETKLDRSLAREEDKEEEDESRSMAAIPPPAALAATVDIHAYKRQKRVVEDILSSLDEADA